MRRDKNTKLSPATREVVLALFGTRDRDKSPGNLPGYGVNVKSSVDPTAELTRYYLGLVNLPNFALDRLSRYEAALWRQVGQVLFTLDVLDRRKPQGRRSWLAW